MDSRFIRLNNFVIPAKAGIQFLLIVFLNLYAQAADLPPGLYARLETSKGDIVCRLFTDEAPAAARTFGMLAQGATQWTDPKTQAKTRRSFYNELSFYKVLPGQLIASGDPLGDGSADAGFSMEREIHPDLKFDQPGYLALDSSGTAVSGSRFFITLKPMPEKNGLHTIFGQVVEGFKVAVKISKVKTDDSGKPKKPVLLETVEIFRVEESSPKKIKK